MITMVSSPYRIRKILKKTKAKMFKNIEVNDVLVLSVEAETAGASRGRSFASYIEVLNVSKCEAGYVSFNDIEKRLAPFELKIILMDEGEDEDGRAQMEALMKLIGEQNKKIEMLQGEKG